MSDLEDLSDQALQQLLAKRELLLKQLTSQKGDDLHKSNLKTRKRKRVKHGNSEGQHAHSKKMAMETLSDDNADVANAPDKLSTAPAATSVAPSNCVSASSAADSGGLSLPGSAAAAGSEGLALPGSASAAGSEGLVLPGSASVDKNRAGSLALPLELSFEGRSVVSSEESDLDGEESVAPKTGLEGDVVGGSDDEEGFQVCEEVYSGDEAEDEDVAAERTEPDADANETPTAVDNHAAIVVDSFRNNTSGDLNLEEESAVDSPEQFGVPESDKLGTPAAASSEPETLPTPASGEELLDRDKGAGNVEESVDASPLQPPTVQTEEVARVDSSSVDNSDTAASIPVKRCPFADGLANFAVPSEKPDHYSAGDEGKPALDGSVFSRGYLGCGDDFAGGSAYTSHTKENRIGDVGDDDDDDDEDGHNDSFLTVEENDEPVVFDGGFFKPNLGADGKNPKTLDDIFNLEPDRIDGLGEDEIDALLEKPMVDYKKEKDLFAGLKKPPDVKNKIVLKYRGTEFFEVLPDGWIELTHCSGIPVYLHKLSRVCTFSRPYFIGPGSARRHDVPISAIPCLYQRRVQEMERAAEQRRQQAATAALVAAAAAVDAKAEEDAPSTSGKLPEVTVESADDFKKRCLSGGQLHDYCSKAFEFYTLKVWRFKTWSEHRKFHKQQRYNRRPALPSNVKLITVPAAIKGAGGRGVRRQFFLNPHGKTSVCLLHEYVQRAMHSSPEYEFGQTNNAAQPYSATVIIQKTLYATGYGNNKKTAKLDAARLTLQVLIPKMDFNDNSKVKLPNEDDVLELFDNFKIDDSRVYELSSKAGQPHPYEILMICLKRNSAFGNTRVNTEIKHVKHQQHRYSMEVGKHKVSVLCSNKKEGKQKASQAMLEKLHPHIKTWGSLIRLYGYDTGSQKGTNGRKDKGAVLVDSNGDVVMTPNDAHLGVKDVNDCSSMNRNGKRDRFAVAHPPNKSILEKLRREMAKLYEQKGNEKSKTEKEKKNEMVANVIQNISF